MISEFTQRFLTPAVTFVGKLPERLLEKAWNVVLKHAPLQSNIPIDTNSLSTWNVLPYSSIEEPVVHYIERLIAAFQSNEVTKNERAKEAERMKAEIRLSTNKFLEDEVGFCDIYRYCILILKSFLTLFFYINAQKAYRKIFSILEDLDRKLRKHDNELDQDDANLEQINDQQDDEKRVGQQDLKEEQNGHVQGAEQRSSHEEDVNDDNLQMTAEQKADTPQNPGVFKVQEHSNKNGSSSSENGELRGLRTEEQEEYKADERELEGQ